MGACQWHFYGAVLTLETEAFDTIKSKKQQSKTEFMQQKNNPLHGITLERLLTELVEQFGWEKLGQWINIRCFQNNPSIKSSLTFLRKTPWARSQVEALYLETRPDAPQEAE